MIFNFKTMFKLIGLITLLVTHIQLSHSQITSQEELNREVLAEFTNIVRNYSNRIREIRENEEATPEIIATLNNGFWYANDYFESLEKYHHIENIKNRLDLLMRKDSFNKLISTDKRLIMKPSTPHAYFLSAGQKASDVIETFGEKLIFIDCTMAYDLAYYRVILKFLGKDKFDAHFSQDKLPLFSALAPSMLREFVEFRQLYDLENHLGVNYYISNHKLYIFKDLSGEAQGFNVLRSGQNDEGEYLYIGFGLDPDGETETAIKEKLVNLFNKRPINARIMLPEIWAKNRPSGFYAFVLNFLQNETITSTEDETIFTRLRAATPAEYPIQEMRNEQLFNNQNANVSNGPKFYLSLKKIKTLLHK